MQSHGYGGTTEATQGLSLCKRLAALTAELFESQAYIPPFFGVFFQFGLVTQSYPPLHDPMDCSTPGFPVHHQLPEFSQTHVHLVSDATQPSHPLSSPSPPALNLSQHQGLFK